MPASNPNFEHPVRWISDIVHHLMASSFHPSTSCHQIENYLPDSMVTLVDRTLRRSSIIYLLTNICTTFRRHHTHALALYPSHLPESINIARADWVRAVVVCKRCRERCGHLGKKPTVYRQRSPSPVIPELDGKVTQQLKGLSLCTGSFEWLF